MSFAMRPGGHVSVQMGFIGLGMGGSRIADAFASLSMVDEQGRTYTPYASVAINTNTQDLMSLRSIPKLYRFPLTGFEQGAGRDIEVGRRAFEANRKELMPQLRRIFHDAEIVYCIAGLGGGTGNGAIISALRAVAEELDKDFGVILTLPHRKEGNIEKRNAAVTLDQFNKVMDATNSVIIIDNEKLYNNYLGRRRQGLVPPAIDWYADSNSHIASTLHEINMLTTSFIPHRSGHFDAAELRNALLQPGCLTFARAVVPERERLTEQDIMVPLRDSWEQGLLANGFDFSEAEAVGVSMIAREDYADQVADIELLDKISDEILAMAESPEYMSLAPYIDPQPGEKNVLIYSVVSGMGLPIDGRIQGLLEEARRASRPTASKRKQFDFNVSIDTELQKRPSLIEALDQIAATRDEHDTGDDHLR